LESPTAHSRRPSGETDAKLTAVGKPIVVIR
jgi:hypothetical protein